MERKSTGRNGAKTGVTAVLEKSRGTNRETGQDMTEQVRSTAYKLFENRGYRHGNDWGDWFEAERTVYNHKK